MIDSSIVGQALPELVVDIGPMSGQAVWLPPVDAGRAGGDSDAEAAFRAGVRDWLAANARPRRAGLPWESPHLEEMVSEGRRFQAAMQRAGFAGITMPVEYGGAGRTLSEEMIWAEESAAYEIPDLYLMIGVRMCGPTLLALGTAEQKRTYLPPLLSGDQLWCQLFSEPGAGSDLGSVATRARKDGDDWVIDGQKVWNTAAQFADIGMLIARTGSVDSKHRGLTMFVLDMATPGVSVRPLRQITGVAEFNEVFLDGVRIPDGNVVGQVDGGWAAVLTMLMNERVGLTGTVTASSTDLDGLVELARSTGADKDPHFRQRFADLYTRAVTVKLLTQRLRSSLRADETPGPEGSIAKLMLSQLVRDRADLMIDAAGVDGIAWPTDSSEAARWSFEVLAAPATSFGGGTDFIQRNVIGERLLKLPREPIACTHLDTDGKGV